MNRASWQGEHALCGDNGDILFDDSFEIIILFSMTRVIRIAQLDGICLQIFDDCLAQLAGHSIIQHLPFATQAFRQIDKSQIGKVIDVK